MATRTSRTKSTSPRNKTHELYSDQAYPTTSSPKKFSGAISVEESLQLHQTVTIMSTLLHELTMSCHDITQLTRSSSYDITIDYIQTYEEIKQLLDVVKVLVKSCDSKPKTFPFSSELETRTWEENSSIASEDGTAMVIDSRDDCCDRDNIVTPLHSSRFQQELEYLTKTCHYMSRMTRGASFETVDYIRGCEAIKQAKKVLKTLIGSLKNAVGEEIWEASADMGIEESDSRDEYDYRENVCDDDDTRTPQPGYPISHPSMTRRSSRVLPPTRSTYSSSGQAPENTSWEASWYRELRSWEDDKTQMFYDHSGTRCRNDRDMKEERDGPPTARA